MSPPNQGYVKLVAEMRGAQKEYFRTKSPSALERSRTLERHVDTATRELLEQPRLPFERKDSQG